MSDCCPHGHIHVNGFDGICLHCGANINLLKLDKSKYNEFPGGELISKEEEEIQKKASSERAIKQKKLFIVSYICIISF